MAPRVWWGAVAPLSAGLTLDGYLAWSLLPVGCFLIFPWDHGGDFVCSL